MSRSYFVPFGSLLNSERRILGICEQHILIKEREENSISNIDKHEYYQVGPPNPSENQMDLGLDWNYGLATLLLFMLSLR